ncbi:MAG: PspC domain-containing protein [Anaerolineales bacterium]|jgi:phage shock protein PspC (stress-responsive transcriptional regulator)|nr:PspC domain-containing protein [Anaerolineales bacterium]
MMENVKLYRSVSNQMIGGVCGGLGAYVNIDPVFVRLLFVLLLFGSDFGFILYLLLWILIPEEGKDYGFKDDSFSDRLKSMGNDVQKAVTQPHPQSGLILGAGLIIIGGILFLDRLNFSWLRWMDFDILWPLILIAGGIVLLIRIRRE